VRAQYNPDAAPTDEQDELLVAGPWCYADELGTRVHECDGAADRTQRSGIYELAYWLRVRASPTNWQMAICHFPATAPPRPTGVDVSSRACAGGPPNVRVRILPDENCK
jgi:hypothetical protein